MRIYTCFTCDFILHAFHMLSHRYHMEIYTHFTCDHMGIYMHFTCYFIGFTYDHTCISHVISSVSHGDIHVFHM